MLDYVVKLTKDATQCSPDDHARLREVGFDDRGILQITLIASWFNYIIESRMLWVWDVTGRQLRSPDSESAEFQNGSRVYPLPSPMPHSKGLRGMA